MPDPSPALDRLAALEDRVAELERTLDVVVDAVRITSGPWSTAASRLDTPPSTLRAGSEIDPDPPR
jgi:hypothetical protein